MTAKFLINELNLNLVHSYPPIDRLAEVFHGLLPVRKLTECASNPKFESLEITGHKLNLEQIKAAVKCGKNIHLKSVGLDVSHLNLVRDEFRDRLNECDDENLTSWKPVQSAVACHLRLGDNWPSGVDRLLRKVVHPDYAPPPISFWGSVRSCTELPLTFIGDFDEGHPYWSQLKKRLPDSVKIQTESVWSDFLMIRGAPYAAISPSTLGWLARFLSDEGGPTYVSESGFLNRDQRPDINLNLSRQIGISAPAIRWRGTWRQKRRLLNDI